MEQLTRYRVPILTAVGALVVAIIVYAAWISPRAASSRACAPSRPSCSPSSCTCRPSSTRCGATRPTWRRTASS